MYRVALLSSLLTFALVGFGCSSSSGSKRDAATADGSASDGTRGDSAPGDSAAGDGALGDGAPGADGPTTSGLKCNGGVAFGAVVSRSCKVPSDCAAVLHGTDCCGSTIWLGINKAGQAAFVAAEKVCAASWPACGCAAGPTRTDDGSQIFGGAKVAVGCQGGRCTTYVEGCGKPCAAGQQCFACSSGPKVDFECSSTCGSKSDCKDSAKPACADGLGGQKFCSTQAVCNAP